MTILELIWQLSHVFRQNGDLLVFTNGVAVQGFEVLKFEDGLSAVVLHAEKQLIEAEVISAGN